MVKVRISIENQDLVFDSKIYIEAELPSSPRIGEMLFIKERGFEKLIALLRKNPNRIQHYYEWVYGESKKTPWYKLNKKNLKDLSFDCAFIVCNIGYDIDNDFVEITLNDK